MRKRYKIGLTVIVILIILVSALGISKIFYQRNNKEKYITNIISNIDNYGYTLDDRDTAYMKEVFEHLKTILKEEPVAEEEYAKDLAKLFVIDFYTLNNKINKYDVGSLEYIYTDKQDMFKTKAMDTIYNDIIDNTYKDRVQKLPEITDVNILDIKEDTIELNGNQEFCYKLTMEYTYKSDLGYDKEGTIYLVRNNNKLEVALYKPEI